VFTTWVCLIKKFQTSENGWENNEKQFCYWGNPWVTLHPASNVLNIYVSVHEHD
jgi:hypothetical protein